MEKLKDILAFCISVGAKPVPFIFAGLVVGLLNEQRTTFEILTAIGLTILAASGVSLIMLPPLLWMKRWADDRYREDHKLWPVSYVVGFAMLLVWLLLFVRLPKLPEG